ncbi:MAG: outer membrane beta-barrel protein [Bdellovibrionia bacterium]
MKKLFPSYMKALPYLSALLFTLNAHATGISVLGGLNYGGYPAYTTQPSYSLSNTSGSLQFSYGIMVDTPIDSDWGLDLGLLYLTLSYGGTLAGPAPGGATTSTPYTSTNSYLVVPILATYRISILKTGLGPYIASGIGNVDFKGTTTVTAGGSTVATQNSSTNLGYGDTHLNSFDFGLAAEVGGDYNIVPNWDLVGTAFFTYSLTNAAMSNNTAYSSLKMMNIALFLGARYSL